MNLRGRFRYYISGRRFIRVWSGLLTPFHIERLGVAVWFYLWCISRQARPGAWIDGGGSLTWRRIAKKMGIPERTVRRWGATCRQGGYVEIVPTSSGVKIRVIEHGKGAGHKL